MGVNPLGGRPREQLGNVSRHWARPAIASLSHGGSCLLSGKPRQTLRRAQRYGSPMLLKSAARQRRRYQTAAPPAHAHGRLQRL